jgi:flagellar basal-body rod protein FlgF
MGTTAFANNAFYITVSNQVARKQDLQIITNNASNSNTVGYEEDSVLFGTQEVMQSSKKNNSYVITEGVYKPGELGPLKFTNNPLDVAIIGKDQYFKILSPRGVRYTLAGAMIRNSQGLIVNSEGYSFLSINNDVLQVPPEASEIVVANDGTIYADQEEVGRIAVVSIPNPNSLIKEGNSLYRSTASELPLDEYTVQSGALRASNVNAARVMGQTIETQRSFSITSSLLGEINDTEKQAINKFLK